MRRAINSKSKFLAGAVEVVEGVNPGALSLIRTSNLEMLAYEGDTRRREYDGDDGRDSPTVKSNIHSAFSFDTDFSGSGDPAVIPSVGAFLQMAGLSRVPNAVSGFDYLIGDPSDMDSGTLLGRRKAGLGDTGGVNYVNYESNGVRGYVGISLQKGNDPLFQFRDMKGSYIRPLTQEELAEIDIVFDAQEYPEVFEDGNVPEFGFNMRVEVPIVGWHSWLFRYQGGYELREVCLHEFMAPNYSGVTVSRSNAINCGGTISQAVPIDFTAKIGWDDSFFELVESHKNIITTGLSMQHGTSAGNQLSIKSDFIQIHDLKEVDIDGEMGMDISGTFLDRPVLTIA